MLANISMIYPICVWTFTTLGLCMSLFIVIRKNRQLASAQQEMIDKLQKKINLQEKSLVSSYLLALLKGRTAKLSGREMESGLEISLRSGSFALVGCYVPTKEGEKPEQDELNFFVVDNVFSELMEGETFYRVEDGRYMYYLFCIPDDGVERWKEKAEKQVGYLCDFLEEHFRMNLTVEISAVETDISQAKNMYQGIMEAFEDHKINGQREMKDKMIVHSVRKYVENNYTDCGLNLNSIAEALGRNSRYLSKVFREETGKGILDYVNELRISKASDLLADGSYSVEAVGEMVGYASTRTFRRTFAKIVGTTPGNFL